MLEQRNLKVDLFALALLAATLFLAVALTTYDRADPPSSLVYPAAHAVNNACGRLGAWTARMMFSGLGIGAFYLVVSMAVLDATLLLRKPIGQPVLRATGWMVSLVALTALAAMAVPSLSPGPVIGSGGYLGAAGRGWLEMHFASAGAYILTLSLLLAGLLLSTDYLLIRAGIWIFGIPAARLWKTRSPSATVGKIAREAHADPVEAVDETDEISDEEDEEEEDEDDDELYDEDEEWEEEDSEAVEEPASTPADEPAIKIRRMGAGDVDEASGANETGDETSAPGDGASDRSTAGGARRVRRRLASALRIGRGRPNSEEHNAVLDQLDAAARDDDLSDYELPPLDMLIASEQIPPEAYEQQVRRTAGRLEKTFANFGFKVKVVEIQSGPVIAQYEIALERGLRLAKITGLADDIAIALRVPSVRIVAPIPGKNTVGIEVPNAERQLVCMRDVIEDTAAKARKMKIPIFLGKDVTGGAMAIDLATLPHLLIAGRTGTGKSVCLNSIIMSMLMTRRPDEVRMLMIDPKMVELSPYQRLPHLMHPVVTDMKKAEAILAWAVDKMEERYALLARAGVRHLSVYNQLGEEELVNRLQPESDEEIAAIPKSLPYIVIVADEIADLMMSAGKDVEQHIIRLAQKSRAVGIHLILATQKPTVDVVTGLIKSNLPARISFQVASRTDSRVVLDEMGADKLLGNGDMLFLWPGTSMLLRGQGTYVSDEEIGDVVNFVGKAEQQFVKELVQLRPKDQEAAGPGTLSRQDELYHSAVDCVVREGRGSVSLLQRTLGIGYGRAARLIDYMAEDNIVGPYNGSQAREILLTAEQWAKMSDDEPPAQSSATATSADARPRDRCDEHLVRVATTPRPAVKSVRTKTEPVKLDDGAPWDESDEGADDWDDEEIEDEAFDEEDEYEDDEEEQDEVDDEVEEEAADETDEDEVEDEYEVEVDEDDAVEDEDEEYEEEDEEEDEEYDEDEWEEEDESDESAAEDREKSLEDPKPSGGRFRAESA